MISLEGVSKTYRRGGGEPVHALRDVSLSIEAGEMVAILGPSGSGKSTLMHVVGLLDRPDAGRYELDGVDVARRSPDQMAALRNRTIGFVFQSFHLLPRSTAVENVELPLIYSDRTDMRPRALRALDEVGLTERASHRPGELSGGQQQRVAVARALVNDPQVVLADEPTGNLDSKAGADVMELFCELHRRGRTVVLITHEEQIAAYADRRLRIVDGEVVADESTGGEMGSQVAMGGAR